MKKLIILLLFVPVFANSQSLLQAIMSSSQNSVITLDANIIAWYKLDEATGTTAYDETGDNNATNTGTADINQTGKVGRAYDFDGTNDYLTLNKRLLSDYPFSFSGWVNMDVVNEQMIFVSNYKAGNYIGVAIELNTSGVNITYGNGLGEGSGKRKTYVYNYTFTAETWYNIVLTANGWAQSDNAVYINGESVAYTSTSGTALAVSWQAEGTTMISHSILSDDLRRVNGKLDQIRIADEIFSVGDIAKLYAEGGN